MTRHPHSTVVHHRNLLAAAGALVALGLLTACSDSDDGRASAKPSPSATPSQSAPSTAPSSQDPADGAKDELLAAYQSYWDEKTAAYAKGSMAGTKLKTYAKGNALGQVMADLKNLKAANQLTKGKPELDPEATVNLEKKVPLGRIKDCIDVSGWKAVDRKSGAEIELPKKRLTKYITHVTAERWGKQWVILEQKPEETAC